MSEEEKLINMFPSAPRDKVVNLLHRKGFEKAKKQLETEYKLVKPLTPEEQFEALCTKFPNISRIHIEEIYKENMQGIQETEKQLNEEIKKKKQQDKTPDVETHRYKYDFHAQSKAQAVEEFNRFLQCAIEQNLPYDTEYELIVGKGLHSINNFPVIKTTILELCETRGIKAEVVKENTGVVRVWPFQKSHN
ncbi:hypothetical protein TVAG_004260 [Trichomonas vaginalis G3]|uniref:Smr domain-containing protein n=1 Tax=Trichomonas vaginalis (strain ATCC PRA-98 / G3) TaxID=412133 RepID=A2FU39_TRIV3|nr:duf1771-domain-containing protein family [Trichomonas vaginalis G3]EAX91586.1 hypothetical protein TVAG_004260 [Trichomonas vaginalis G3]KAI5500736.1 duf1771-domain-containing protein family [Trichomonas vaginalis G3]|eukprot:XP_001304516.1 hypothetical protein [Trichomonas vaginalis G3]